MDAGAIAGAATGSAVMTSVFLLMLRSRLNKVDRVEDEVAKLRDQRVAAVETKTENLDKDLGKAFEARRRIHEDVNANRVQIAKRFGEVAGFRQEMLAKIDGLGREIKGHGEQIENAVLDARQASREVAEVAAKVQMLVKQGGGG